LKNQNISISSNSVYDSIAYDPVKNRLLVWEAEVEESTHQNGWNQVL